MIFTDNNYLNKALYSYYKAISNMFLLGSGCALNDSFFKILRQIFLIQDARTRIKLCIYAIIGNKLYMKLKKLISVNNIKYYTDSKHS